MNIELNALQALSLLRDIALSEVRDDAPDLTFRQLSILLTIYLEAPPHTIRALAVRLAVTKPVITRALDTMGALGFVERHRDIKDMRNVLIKRTLKGALYVERIGDLVISTARNMTK